MYLMFSGVGSPAGGIAAGSSVTVLMAEYRMTPSKRSFGYDLSRSCRPADNHEGGGGYRYNVSIDSVSEDIHNKSM